MRKRTAKKIISRTFRETIKSIKGKNAIAIKRLQEALETLKAESYIIDFDKKDVELFARYKDSKSLRIHDDRVTKVYRVKRSKVKY